MKPPPSLRTQSIIFKGQGGGKAAYFISVILFVLAKFNDDIPAELDYVAYGIIAILMFYQIPSTLSKKPAVTLDPTGIQIDGLPLIQWDDISTFGIINYPETWPHGGDHPEVRLGFKDDAIIPRPKFPRNLFYLPVTIGTKAIILHLNQMQTKIVHINGIKTIAEDIEKYNLTTS